MAITVSAVIAPISFIIRFQRRQANAALYRIVIVRLRRHQPTLDYAARRTAQGLSKRDIVRCLKRFVARGVYRALLAGHAARSAALPTDALATAA